ncbi:type-F conjugative transfer system pilin assembly protein TrbC [Cellvibrio sp.]|uniref:type-F conjugative transfer system pilin assembly protein TrbC n=1 Tax=Cellvibrio sp. TaxID=1965322 RepID=UPI003964805E
MYIRFKPTTYIYTILISLILIVANSYAEKYIEPDANILEQQKKMAQDVFKKVETPAEKKEIDNVFGAEKKSIDSVSVPDTNNSINFPEARGLTSNEWKKFEADSFTAKSNVEKKEQREKYPIIFVSFSMPEQQIKALIEEAPHYGAAVVIRGLIKDDFKVTVSKLRQLAGTPERASGILIDPTLFKMFDISTVPSFVLPLSEFDACTPGSCAPPQHVKLAGSATLAYVLDLISRTGSAREKQEANFWLNQKSDK